MRYLFGTVGRAVLESLREDRTLFAFDYDGTLAPLPRRSVESVMPDGTRVLLTRLARERPCAVVSGRGLEDLRERVGRDVPCVFVGNHGMEPEGRIASARGWMARTRAWEQRLVTLLADVPGVTVEGKRFSISLHWRGVSNESQVLPAIREAVATLPGARLIGGKKVLNILPPDAPDKGIALLALKRRFRARRVLFVGDDVTDEDGFALGESAGLIGVRVGQKASSRATFFLRRQAEMNRLLRLLAGARSA